MRKLTIGFLALVLFGGLYWFRTPILVLAGKWLVVETSLQAADLVIALGGSRERQDKAVDLLKQGFAKRILFTGSDFRPIDYACLSIGHQGIEPSMVAYRTYDEALVTKKVMEANGFQSAIIVTSPYHLRRTRLIFIRVFGDNAVRLMFSPSSNKAFSMNDWWESHYGRKVVIIEYLGLVYYGLTLLMKN